MGCIKSKSGPTQPKDPTAKRELMAEAAERRMKQQESRGIKDVDKLKRKEETRKRLEEKACTTQNQYSALRWTAN